MRRCQAREELERGPNMKIKFWQFEYDFDKDDAKIVVPLVLLLVAISVTSLDPLWILAPITVYYLLYFFGAAAIRFVSAQIEKKKMRCPKCKNRKIILQGYDGYKSDAHDAITSAMTARPHRS